MMVIRDSARMGGVDHIYFRKRRDSLRNGDMFMDYGTAPGRRDFAYDGKEFRMRPHGMNRKNVQIFNYENIDNEGISTHIRFKVSETTNEDLKRMPHVEGGRFEIENLSILT